MEQQAVKKWSLFVLRWGIAVGGIWWVVANMSLRDRVTVLDGDGRPVDAFLAEPAKEEAAAFKITDPQTGEARVVNRREVVSRPDQAHALVGVKMGEKTITAKVLALDLSDDLRRVRRLVVEEPETGKGIWVWPEQIVPKYQLRVPHPRVDVGVITMAKLADPAYLWGAVLIFPVTFLVTSYRWHLLLKALDIHMTQARAFVINMVGAFYNSFMPGSTGGDVLKAYYAAKQTPHRTRAVMSVVVDRAIGLYALVIMGGVMAGVQYMNLMRTHPEDPAVSACGRVALGAAAILAATVGGLWLFREPVRRAIGLDTLLKKLPMQKQVQHVIGVMSTYRKRPGLVAWTVVATFPVHITVVISAMLAGQAFGLPLPLPYYFVAVPVIVLSGAIPISPQGAGVMEFFAILLTRQYGATVSQAFALTMSIRLVQMVWNLTGGIFVLRGGYHAPSVKEQEEMEEEEEEVQGQKEKVKMQSEEGGAVPEVGAG